MKNAPDEEKGPEYIRYTPQQPEAGIQQRVIRMMEVKPDPLEPPRFKHKKVVVRSSSPPPPVLHSPSKKISAAEKKEWFIPPCISNWKNQKGYTISLDKRLAADGRNLQEHKINDRFASFAEALFIAERHAREEVEKRNQMAIKLAQKEKEMKEQKLREMARQAREAVVHREFRDEGVAERDRIRREQQQQIQKQIRIQQMGKETKAKYMAKLLDRDVSEKVALGVAHAKESLYDQRLFNQTSGLDSGFKDEDSYNIYDKPLFSNVTSIYRPKARTEDEEIDVDLRETRFVPSKSFAGADKAAKRDGPVEFEKAEDVFGIEDFLNEAVGDKRKRED
jgi:SNW domain-containing protein 1